jgi:hypothetical protein
MPMVLEASPMKITESNSSLGKPQRVIIKGLSDKIEGLGTQALKLVCTTMHWCTQGVTKRCRPWLTYSALVYKPKWGGGGCEVLANEYSCAHGAQTNFGDLTSYLTYGCTQKLLKIRIRAAESPWILNLLHSYWLAQRLVVFLMLIIYVCGCLSHYEGATFNIRKMYYSELLYKSFLRGGTDLRRIRSHPDLNTKFLWEGVSNFDHVTTLL